MNNHLSLNLKIMSSHRNAHEKKRMIEYCAIKLSNVLFDLKKSHFKSKIRPFSTKVPVFVSLLSVIIFYVRYWNSIEMGNLNEPFFLSILLHTLRLFSVVTNVRNNCHIQMQGRFTWFAREFLLLLLLFSVNENIRVARNFKHFKS